MYFVGNAGSGKTTVTRAFKNWMDQRSYDSVVVNLDPGVEYLPYSPDIDVRDWISLNDVMGEYNVGPNGAQIIASDLLVLKIGEIQELMGEFETNYFLIDTPGQMELFTLRQSTREIINSLGRDSSMVAFLFDPFLSTTPNGYLSLLMQSLSTQFMLELPISNFLTKIDLLTQQELDKILSWGDDSFELFDALSASPNLQSQMGIEFFKALQVMDSYKPLTPISSESGDGLADIYNVAQQMFMGGEDLYKD